MTPRRHAQGGKCERCRGRVVRGFDQHGTFVVVDIYGTTAPHETLSRADGVGSYVLGWRGLGMVIVRRSDDDVLLRPAGTRSERVVLDHRCPPSLVGAQP